MYTIYLNKNSNFSRPLIDGTANEEEAMDINKIVEILSEDMNNRLQILLTVKKKSNREAGYYIRITFMEAGNNFFSITDMEEH